MRFSLRSARGVAPDTQVDVLLKATVATSFDGPRLPVELWLEIAELVEGNRNLFALCHTSSMLRTLALARFKTLDLLTRGIRILSREEQFNELRIVGAFRQPVLAAVVTRFDVQLVPAPSICPRAGRPCHCRSLENCISEVLSHMVNLEHLSIHCLLCPKMGKHQYFNDLQPRKLRSFSCRCSCGAITHHKREQLLLAPMLSTIEALRWIHGAQDMMHPWSAGTLLDSPSVMPNLTRLAHQGKHTDNCILTSRPIQRICVTSEPRFSIPFLRALYTFPGSLTHIIMEKFFKLDSIIAENPQCFVNIEHIGTVPAIPRGIEVETYLAPFMSLPRLSSIDVMVLDGRDPWDSDLLPLLRNSHLNLRKVLVQGDDFFIWELVQTTWKRRDVSRFSSWDIIRGVLDDV